MRSNRIFDASFIAALRGHVDSGVLDSHEALRRSAEMGWQAASAAGACAERRFVASVHESMGRARTLVVEWVVATDAFRAHVLANKGTTSALILARTRRLYHTQANAERALREFAGEVRDTMPSIQCPPPDCDSDTPPCIGVALESEVAFRLSRRAS